MNRRVSKLRPCPNGKIKKFNQTQHESIDIYYKQYIKRILINLSLPKSTCFKYHFGAFYGALKWKGI
ncbi:hypothetical protein EAP58_23870 [Salmonella enterica]|nr:hypothetical protein [Salmonella enterica]